MTTDPTALSRMASKIALSFTQGGNVGPDRFQALFRAAYDGLLSCRTDATSSMPARRGRRPTVDRTMAGSAGQTVQRAIAKTRERTAPPRVI